MQKVPRTTSNTKNAGKIAQSNRAKKQRHASTLLNSSTTGAASVVTDLPPESEPTAVARDAVVNVHGIGYSALEVPSIHNVRQRLELSFPFLVVQYSLDTLEDDSPVDDAEDDDESSLTGVSSSSSSDTDSQTSENRMMTLCQMPLRLSMWQAMLTPRCRRPH